MGSTAETLPTPSFIATPSLFSLANRTIAITGGGRGLGITLAAAVVECGAHAACIDILPSPSELEWAALLNLAKISNLTISYHKCDITQEKDIASTLDLIAATGAQIGAPLHGVIACAGIQQKVAAVEYLYGREVERECSLDRLYVRTDCE